MKGISHDVEADKRGSSAANNGSNPEPLSYTVRREGRDQPDKEEIQIRLNIRKIMPD